MIHAGHRAAETYSAQANVMATDAVWGAMGDAFEGSDGPLARRLMAALEAGEAAGGDVRGRQSAAILVVPAAGESGLTVTDLRVDDAPEPLDELRRLLDLGDAYELAERGDEALSEGRHADAATAFADAAAAAPDRIEMVFWAGLGQAAGGEVDGGRGAGGAGDRDGRRLAGPALAPRRGARPGRHRGARGARHRARPVSRPATSPAYGDLDPELLAGHDEAFGPDGEPRAAYESLFAQLSGRDLDELAAAAGRAAAGRGIDFGAGTDRLHVDALPRLVGAEEWASLRAGLGQRARALNEFIADVYGERRIVAAGIVPSSVVESADHFEPDLAGTHPDAALAPVVGFDLVRDADGVLRVLEDNLRTPSGLAYSLAIREALDELGLVAPAERAEPALALERLAAVLGEGGGRAVMLSDGPGNSAWFEHRELARALDIEIFGPGDLTARGDRVLGGGKEVATVYRRTDEDRLRDDRGELTWVGELLARRCAPAACGWSTASGRGSPTTSSCTPTSRR